MLLNIHVGKVSSRTIHNMSPNKQPVWYYRVGRLCQIILFLLEITPKVDLNPATIMFLMTEEIANALAKT